MVMVAFSARAIVRNGSLFSSVVPLLNVSLMKRFNWISHGPSKKIKCACLILFAVATRFSIGTHRDIVDEPGAIIINGLSGILPRCFSKINRVFSSKDQSNTGSSFFPTAFENRSRRVSPIRACFLWELNKDLETKRLQGISLSAKFVTSLERVSITK